MKPYPLTDKDSIDLLMMGSVKAGVPSPAEEVREKLDLVKLLVQHSASTFFFRIDGISMVDADIIGFDENGFRYLDYEETESYRITEMMINHRDLMVSQLLQEED